MLVLAGAFSVGTMFAELGLFWLIGAAAAALWWRYGVEARGVALEALVAALTAAAAA